MSIATGSSDHVPYLFLISVPHLGIFLNSARRRPVPKPGNAPDARALTQAQSGAIPEVWGRRSPRVGMALMRLDATMTERRRADDATDEHADRGLAGGSDRHPRRWAGTVGARRRSGHARCAGEDRGCDAGWSGG